MPGPASAFVATTAEVDPCASADHPRSALASVTFQTFAAVSQIGSGRFACERAASSKAPGEVRAASSATRAENHPTSQTPALPAQKLELRRMKERLAIGARQWRSLLRVYQVTSAHRLTYEQANELLRVLRRRLGAELKPGAERASAIGSRTTDSIASLSG